MVPLLFALVGGFVQGPPWARFTRDQVLAHTQEVVEIGSGKRSSGTSFPYIMKLTRKKFGAEPTALWADSTTCPAMNQVVASMVTITMPRPAPYGVPGGSQQIVVDGTGYELSAPSSDVMGHVTIGSNVGSPLAQWVDDALKQLESCWSSAGPN